jgi:hypothetical protein
MGAWPSPPEPRKVTVASSFEHLRVFIQTRMRMAHIYQPVMIKELLTHGGKASIRNIAAAFLARDASQLEYYEQITKVVSSLCSDNASFASPPTTAPTKSDKTSARKERTEIARCSAGERTASSRSSDAGT